MLRHSVKSYQAMLGIAPTIDMLHTSGKPIAASFEDVGKDGFSARFSPEFTSDALCLEIGLV
ncbi:hypothetical protein AABM17_8 [Neisseria musculi]|uniref:Uncharacterized protein n=1 Tax=Neisseria musculi TaxID=1815583 RepID=A0A7H1MDA9_9NEIS|nr:hypothetical protein H7A79_0008 [Neisseria musculi]